MTITNSYMNINCYHSNMSVFLSFQLLNKVTDLPCTSLLLATISNHVDLMAMETFRYLMFELRGETV